MQTKSWLRHRCHDSGSYWLAIDRGVVYPLQKVDQLAHMVLSKAMLLQRPHWGVFPVVVKYWLSSEFSCADSDPAEAKAP